jgi:hypothetical protein
MHREMGRKRKRITGWRLFFFTIVALTVLWLLDDRSVRAAATRGFYPPDTYCMISSWDFPRAWVALVGGDAMKRMKRDWPRPYMELELAARLGTGIRPTPPRWGLWLGKRTVFAFAPEGVGITAYPGHLLRWADALRSAIGYGPGADGIATYRDYCYAWREGYLVASPFRAYVEAALSGDSAPRLHSDSEALLTFQWEGQHRGFINLLAGAGLPVSGQLEFAATDGERPMTLPQAWPSTPVISLTARSADDLDEVWSAIDGALAGSSAYSSARAAALGVARTWGLAPPDPNWDAGADHISIALIDVDTRSAIPTPDLAFAMRYAEAVPESDPFSGILANRQAIPFEWNNCPGFMAPLLGTEWSPCVAKSPHEWIMTTRGPVMAEVAGNLADGPACAAEADITLRASWEKLGTCAEAVVSRLGADEILPRMNIDDVSADVLPKITALSKLGEIAIDGVSREGTLKFSGYLAKAAKGAGP